MKAISIRQPWSWLIVRPDLVGPEARRAAARAEKIKDIENRTWASKHRGATFVHAAKVMTKAEYGDVQRWLEGSEIQLPHYADLERGGIVGVVDVVDCVRKSASRWFIGGVGFVLENPRPLKFKELKGELGFFGVADEVAAEFGFAQDGSPRRCLEAS